MNIETVRVVGLGTPGTQLAIQAADYGHEVHGFDPEPGNIQKMMAKVRAAMQMTRDGPTFPLDRWEEHAAKVRIHSGLASAVGSVVLVIEVVPENRVPPASLHEFNLNPSVAPGESAENEDLTRV